MNDRSHLIGRIYVLAAAVLWGTTGTSQAFAPDGATSLSIGAMRLIGGSLLLLLLAHFRGVKLHGLNMPIRLTAIAAIAIAAYQVSFFAGVMRTGVAVGTVVGIGSSPIMAGFIVWLLYRERLSRRWMVATVLAILGCVLLLVVGRSVEVDPLGILLAVIAGLSYAVFTIAGKELLPGRTSEQVMAVTFSLGSILLLPVLLTANMKWLAQPRGVFVALQLAVVTVGVAYTLFGLGLERIPAATAVSLTLAEPLTAAGLGILILGERLTAASMGGVVLILAGLAMLSIPRRWLLGLLRQRGL